MAEIKYLSTCDLSKPDSIERIVAAAKSEPGLWLMVIEHLVEIKAARACAPEREMEAGATIVGGLKPTIAELADRLVSRMFGHCPPDMLPAVQKALLEAADAEFYPSDPEPS